MFVGNRRENISFTLAQLIIYTGFWSTFAGTRIDRLWKILYSHLTACNSQIIDDFNISITTYFEFEAI